MTIRECIDRLLAIEKKRGSDLPVYVMIEVVGTETHYEFPANDIASTKDSVVIMREALTHHLPRTPEEGVRDAPGPAPTEEMGGGLAGGLFNTNLESTPVEPAPFEGQGGAFGGGGATASWEPSSEPNPSYDSSGGSNSDSGSSSSDSGGSCDGGSSSSDCGGSSGGE